MTAPRGRIRPTDGASNPGGPTLSSPLACAERCRRCRARAKACRCALNAAMSSGERFAALADASDPAFAVTSGELSAVSNQLLKGWGQTRDRSGLWRSRISGAPLSPFPSLPRKRGRVRVGAAPHPGHAPLERSLTRPRCCAAGPRADTRCARGRGNRAALSPARSRRNGNPLRPRC